MAFCSCFRACLWFFTVRFASPGAPRPQFVLVSELVYGFLQSDCNAQLSQTKFLVAILSCKRKKCDQKHFGDNRCDNIAKKSRAIIQNNLVLNTHVVVAANNASRHGSRRSARIGTPYTNQKIYTADRLLPQGRAHLMRPLCKPLCAQTSLDFTCVA